MSNQSQRKMHFFFDHFQSNRQTVITSNLLTFEQNAKKNNNNKKATLIIQITSNRLNPFCGHIEILNN